MVLTLQGSGKQLKLLATEAVSSGGGSGSGKLVPVILLTFKERERAHEQPGHGRNLKQSPAGCDTHWNTVATRRTPRRRSRPELEKREELWRLRGLERKFGGALDSQESDEDTGLLNLAREGVVRANLEEKGSSGSLAQDGGNARRRPRCAQVEGKASPRHPRRLATLAASSCVHSRMRAALLARQLRWAGSR
jgi:hypothetical protein